MKVVSFNKHSKLIGRIAVLFSAIVAVSSTLAMPGDLDPTLGLGGVAVDNALDRTFDSVIQADGKILVAGTRRYCPVGICLPSQLIDVPALARFNPDGSVDLTFGVNGRVVETDAAGRFRTVLLKPNGKILSAGTIGSSYVIRRYNVDGSADSSFSSNVPFAPVNSIYDSFVATPEPGTSKLIVAGNSTTANSFGTITVARLNSDGSWDTTFGSGGTQSFSGLGLLAGISADLWTKKIAIAASMSVAMTACMLNQDGSIDTNFGSGCQAAPMSGYNIQNVSSITFQRWPQLVGGFTFVVSRLVMVGTVQVTGQNVYRLGVVRLRLDGSFDTGFNTTGQLAVSFGSGNTSGGDVAIDSNGRLNVTAANGGRFDMARINRDGSLDSTFGSGGLVSTLINVSGVPVTATANSISIQTDGKIVLAGTAGTVSSPSSGHGNVAIARFES